MSGFTGSNLLSDHNRLTTLQVHDVTKKNFKENKNKSTRAIKRNSVHNFNGKQAPHQQNSITQLFTLKKRQTDLNNNNCKIWSVTKPDQNVNQHQREIRKEM